MQKKIFYTLIKRSVVVCAASVLLYACTPADDGRKVNTTKMQTDHITLGMVLEPPGLDPTTSAASAVAEVVLYNVFETLTKIQPDGNVKPLLAHTWEASQDQRVWTFHLRDDVQFHNGEPFNARVVRYAFERAAAQDSTNKDKALFASFEKIIIPDAYTVVLYSKHPNPNLPFLLGQATAIMVEPNSVENNRTKPIGTGPYMVAQWKKGASVTLQKWAQYRSADNISINSAVFRFVSDTAAQSAALLAGDIDLFTRTQVARILKRFQDDAGFQVLIGASRAKTIMAINNGKKPLNDVRVRRAISAAIDRQAVIEVAADGLGVPIGSFYVPGALGYVDTTHINAYDPEKARALLAEAGVKDLTLTMKLPPTPYAKQGAEVIAAMLGQVGIHVKMHSVEWAQWLTNVYGQKDYDLTIISHVEPFDFGNFAKPNYYWNYQSSAFNALYEHIIQTGDTEKRAQLLAQAQELVAHDAVAAYLYQPQWITVADSRLQGVWQDMPIFVNDLSSLSWK